MSQDWRGRRIAAVALAALFLVGGCGGQALPSPSPAAPERDSACATVRLAMPCHAITVDGRMQRYAVVPGEGAAAGDLVLVDLGGPGRSLFGTNDLVEFAAMWGIGRTLVFLEEPWSVTALEPSCRDALSRTYVA